MIANDNLRIEQGDHVIMFLTDKNLLPTSSVYSSQVHSSCNDLGAQTKHPNINLLIFMPFIFITIIYPQWQLANHLLNL